MHGPSVPVLAEELVLVLFQPRTGTLAGARALSPVLAGAVLADLVLRRVVLVAMDGGAIAVRGRRALEPLDGLLRPAWAYVADGPRPLADALAAIGPALRQPLLERLVARGDLREQHGKVLGVLSAPCLQAARGGRRPGLVRELRGVLVDGMEAAPRVAALAALVWGSGALRQFDPEIPWSRDADARGEAFARGEWNCAVAAGDMAALVRGVVATIPQAGA